MQKKNTKLGLDNSNPAIERVNWSVRNVQAFQTTRHHPNITNKNLFDIQSSYGNFNLGLHVNDDEQQVNHNRCYIEQYLLQGKKIQWLNQVHGNDVAFIEQVSSEPLTADACITENKDIALAIMTADCLPILLASHNGEKIAAIHGGWRSLAANIIEITIKKMALNTTDIQVWLGPCIGDSAFEVGSEVKAAFVNINPQYSSAFKIKNHDKYLASLHTLAKIQLMNLGVTAIYSLAECSYSLPQKYYSYRRRSVTGRMASIIAHMP